MHGCTVKRPGGVVCPVDPGLSGVCPVFVRYRGGFPCLHGAGGGKPLGTGVRRPHDGGGVTVAEEDEMAMVLAPGHAVKLGLWLLVIGFTVGWVVGVRS
ncbi:hypothetical protein Aglo01_33080 [Actinokineospora globicatena]|nr:hypothetical protein Aglo01_33080 [Actinokineospora globicatena]GLW84507.1 hypothetical protein Aglo02_21470 [Actinokineospora globicatena]